MSAWVCVRAYVCVVNLDQDLTVLNSLSCTYILVCVCVFAVAGQTASHCPSTMSYPGSSSSGQIRPTGKNFTPLVALPSDQRPFQCGLCSQMFDALDALVHHVHNHPKPFQCGYCDSSFESKLELSEHVDSHDVFVCVPHSTATAMSANNVVRKPTDTSSGIMSTNPPERHGGDTYMSDPLPVQQLLSTTEGSIQSQGHQQNRTPEDPAKTPLPVACPACGERFKLQVDLKKHYIEKHHDDRPFWCTQCPSRFKQNIHLTDHMERAHVSGKPHACPICGATFKLLNYVRHHIRRVHHADPATILGGQPRRHSAGSQENAVVSIPACVRFWQCWESIRKGSIVFLFFLFFLSMINQCLM